MGKYDQAFADCNGLIENGSRRTSTLINNRADVYVIQKGDFDAALKDYTAALRYQPETTSVRIPAVARSTRRKK